MVQRGGRVGATALLLALVLAVAVLGPAPGATTPLGGGGTAAAPVSEPVVGSTDRVRKKRVCRKRAPRRTCRAPRVVRPRVQASQQARPPAPPGGGDGPLTWSLERSEAPTADEADAYGRISVAMDEAVARYNRRAGFRRHLHVSYAPGVPTAEAGGDQVRFGADRQYMTERVALHEVSHTLGLGTSAGWFRLCGGDGSGSWSGPQATALLRSWDGAGAVLSCGGHHVWPYGLNYDYEFSETNADRHVLLVAAMVADGQ